MSVRKIIKDNTNKAWSYLSVYSAFYKRHKEIYSYPDFERVSLTQEEKKNIATIGSRYPQSLALRQ